jgi:hypothetical protein
VTLALPLLLAFIHPSAWKRNLKKFGSKIAANVSCGFEDAYGDARCLSACYRDTAPGIRRAKVIA